jgi:hypothetical protein
MYPGSRLWMRILDKPSKLLAISSPPYLIYGPIGLGIGIALGLLLAAAFDSFPGWRLEPAAA